MARDKKSQLTKADTDARFAALQEINRAKRETKVTREDVAKRLQERKVHKAQRTVPGQRSRIVSLGLGIALLVGAGAVGVTVTSGTAEFNRSMVATEQQIADAQSFLALIPARDDEATAAYAAELEASLAEATVKGEEVAELQDGFTAILFQGNGELSANGAPTQAFREAVNHRHLLSPYFVSDALLASEAEAYAPGSVLPFDTGRIDPRFPWYVGYEPASHGRTVVDPAVSKWELVSVVASDVEGILAATWLNSSPDTGDLYAWATASYYAEATAFGNLTVGFTTIGERGIPSLNSEGV